jgi:predicted nucleic acid-binding Zn finger protein
MATFTEVLPASKSNPHRAMKWTPACVGVGTLELTDKRTHVRYAVASQPFGGVRMTRTDGETYVVTAGTCDCAGYTFGRGKLCKHIVALHALLSNRWLEQDDRETVTDVAEEIEAKDAWYAAATGGTLCYEPAGA